MKKHASTAPSIVKKKNMGSNERRCSSVKKNKVMVDTFVSGVMA